MTLGLPRDWAIEGDRTGRIWRLHPTADKIEANGDRYYAVGDDGSRALIHRCEKGSYWDDEIERMRLAIELGDRPEVRACATIRQLLDVHETNAEMVGEWEIRGNLIAIWEWADTPLHTLPDDPGPGRTPIADQVQTNVGAALEVLHSLGIVHCDMAPNNILCVEGCWKLADLDSCVARGAVVNRGPTNERYRHPDRRDGPTPARDVFDTWALERVVERLREKGW